MTFIDFLNQVFSVIRLYVSFLFSLEFSPGVSIGSVMLVSLLLFVIVVNIWPRA